VRPLSK
jgi:hypothetical protein